MSENCAPQGRPAVPARAPRAGGRRKTGALGSRGRKIRFPAGGRDTAVVLGLLAVAVAAVWVVLEIGNGRGTAARPPRRRPASVLPARVPYRDLVGGKVRELPDGRVEILYTFERAPVEGNRSAFDGDPYPELADWNRRLAGSRARASVVRGEGRLRGEARTRLAFSGPVEVSVDLEIRKGAAAIQLATDRAGVGYECMIGSDGTVRLRLLRVVKEEDGKRARIKVEELAGPVRGAAIPPGRRIAALFVKSEDALRVELDGREVLRAPLPSPDPFPGGNVALRSPGGRVLWDDVRITGTLDPDWIEVMMAMAVRLTGRDDFEPDDTWPTARELLADGSEQERSFSPWGDVDWVSVAVPEGVRFVRVETLDLHLGIGTELAVFGPDGKTPLDFAVVPAGDSGVGARAIVVPTGGAEQFYLRISPPEGRVGTYRLRASPATASPATKDLTVGE